MTRLLIPCCLTLAMTNTAQPDNATPTLPPEAAKWEAMLDPKLRHEPAYQFVQDDPALPRVLLIGDSISVGYTPVVREALKGKANVHRIPENGGDTWRGLTKLNLWLSTGKWDVIHFNFGLHDLKHLKDNQLDLAGEQISTLEAYQTNLDKLVVELKKTGAKLIWATSTPVPAGAKGRLKGDDVIYNAASTNVMTRHGVTINDLYAHVMPDLAKYQRPKDVHFNGQGYEFLGKKVAEEIRKALK